MRNHPKHLKKCSERRETSKKHVFKGAVLNGTRLVGGWTHPHQTTKNSPALYERYFSLKFSRKFRIGTRIMGKLSENTKFSQFFCILRKTSILRHFGDMCGGVLPGGPWRILAAPGSPWRPLAAPGGPWHSRCGFIGDAYRICILAEVLQCWRSEIAFLL